MIKERKFIHDEKSGIGVGITNVVIPDYLAGRPDLEDAACEIEMLRHGLKNYTELKGSLPPRADRQYWKRGPNGTVVVDAARKAADQAGA